MPTLTAPKLVSSRAQAQELTAGLPEELSTTTVVVDCSALQASTPSFVDELIRLVLSERKATQLTLQNAPERTIELARRAAEIHGVLDRLQIE
jgi:hypothetical protein